MRTSSRNDRSVPAIGAVLPMVILIAYSFLPIQLYGSNVSCDPTVDLANQSNCGERTSSANSVSKNKLQSNDFQEPLILPDITPTIEDLDNVERDDFKKPTDPDNIDSNVEINSDNEEESEEETSEDNSEENEKEESGDRSSLIPFP